jgi:hypothetical protein
MDCCDFSIFCFDFSHSLVSSPVGFSYYLIISLQYPALPGCRARVSPGALNAGQAWKQHTGNDLWDWQILWKMGF